jgi:hypothetical protein
MVAGLLLRSGAAAATFRSDCAASAQKLIQRERRHPGPAVTATGTVTRLAGTGPGSTWQSLARIGTQPPPAGQPAARTGSSEIQA